MVIGRHEPSGKKHLSSEQLRRALSKNGKEGALRWVRWCRWSGMLGMASRSLSLGLSSIGRALNGLAGASENAGSPNEAIHSLFHDALMAWDTPVTGREDKQRFRIEALRVLDQYVELQLARLSVIRRLGGKKPHGTPDGDLVEMAVNTAKELVRRVFAEDFSTGARNSVRLDGASAGF